MKPINLVLAVWSIIIGGLIIFIDGNGWCIACRGTFMTVLGIISLLLGAVAIATGMGKAPSTVGN